MSRKKIPKEIENKVLVESRRRCCICYGLKRDSEIKKGQIAHLDRDCDNNKIENLAFLCFDHHDEYDSRSSQSKALTISEVRVYRAELQESLAAALREPLILSSTINSNYSWPGLYRWENPYSSAEINITINSENELRVNGIAFWGIKNPNGPHIGDIDAPAFHIGEKLHIKQDEYILILEQITGGGFEAIEPLGNAGQFGMNVSFKGTYTRVPVGADVFPQTRLKPFESEFWPEEGKPIFVAREINLELRARPTSEAPIVRYFSVLRGEKIEFRGFRYRTLRPGTILLKRDLTIIGRNLGQTDYVSHANYYEDGGEEVSVRLKKGCELEYLQYRAEGTGFIRWQGIVLDVSSLPWLGDSEEFEKITEPVAESWVQVEGGDSEFSGWVLADNFLDEVDRDFG